MGILSFFCNPAAPKEETFAQKAAQHAGTMARAARRHRVLGTKLGDVPEGFERCVFATGCFWGSEKAFWRVPGVHTTAVGYAAGKPGYSAPTYEQVCGGHTGAVECVQVTWNPKIVSFADLLRVFFESHDPTQGNRQGGDAGSQYRSGIYCTTKEQLVASQAAKEAYGKGLRREGKGRTSKVTTEVMQVPTDRSESFFAYAEDYHQQYLAAPGSRKYCSAEPTGVHLEAATKWMPPELLERFCDRLPPEYWAKHRPQPGCVLRQPDKRVRLESL